MQKTILMVALALIGLVLPACGGGEAEDTSEFNIVFLQGEEEEGVKSGYCPISNPVQVETGEKGYAQNTLPSEIMSIVFSLWSQKYSGDVLEETKLVETRVEVSNTCSDPYTCMTPGTQSFVLYNVPTQQNMHLKAEAFDSTNNLIWIGHNYKVSVIASNNANATPEPVDLYMRRSGNMTWGFNCMQFGKVFHTATMLRDGNILVVGGASNPPYPDSCSPEEFGKTVACDLYIATTEVLLYDVNKGEFKQMTSLREKRAGHQAVLLADGRVMIMGGTERVWVLKNQDGQSYLETDVSWIKNTAVIYNPNGSGSLEEDPVNMLTPRAFFTVTPIDKEPPKATRFLIAGGFGDGGRLTALEKLTFEPAGAATFEQVYASTGVLSLKAPRAGHTATRIQGGQIFFYGGTEPGGSSADAPVAEIFISETLGINLPTAFGDFDQWPNLYYHGASAFDDGKRVLIAGGLQKTRDTEGSGEVLSNAVQSALLVDFETNQATELRLSNARAFNTIVTIPGAESDEVYILGGAAGDKLSVGVTDWERLSNNGISYMLEPAVVSDGALQLGIPRLGHTATVIKDGSVVIIGGAKPEPMEGNVAQKVILQSSETYCPVPQ